MKKIKSLSAILILITTISFGFLSCDNEPIDPAIDLNNPNTGGGNGNGGGSGGNTTALFKADFNGQTWTATNTIADISGGAISIIGLKANGQTFGFTLNGVTTGTYPANQNLLAYSNGVSQYGYLGLNINNPAENLGSVIVTNINTTAKTISGTFSFKGYWTDTTVTNVPPIQFTNGVFTNIPYVTDGNGSDTDLWDAKIDGTTFVETTIDVVETSSPGVGDFYSIVASKANGDSVGLSIGKSLVPGTYAMDGTFGATVSGSTLLSNSLYRNIAGGTLTIISKSATRIKGSFSFTAKNFDQTITKQISQGTFDVEY
jgi:hypothetical protein